MVVRGSKELDVNFEKAKLPMQHKLAICDVFATNGITDAAQVQQALDIACIRYRLSAHRKPRQPSKASSKKDLVAFVQGQTTTGKSAYFNQFIEAHVRRMTARTEVSDPAAMLSDGLQRWMNYEYVLEILVSAPRAALKPSRWPGARPDWDTNRGMRSRERFYLWEPVFDLWSTGHRGVPSSPTIPIMSILDTLHSGLQLDPPSKNSVRDAIKGWRIRKNMLPSTSM